jgi:hypothetical protein
LKPLDALAARKGQAAEETKGGGEGEDSQELIELRMAVERACDRRLKLMLADGPKRELDANADDLTQAIDALERAEDRQKAAGGGAVESVGTGVGKGSVLNVGRTLSAADIAGASKSVDPMLVEYA